MLPWKTYRTQYFHTLSDACVSDARFTDGKNKNILAFIRAGIELGISACVVLFYLSRRRLALKEGSSKAASFMVLPSYAFILYWIVFLQAVHIVTVSLRAYQFQDERDNNIMGNVTLVIRFVDAILDDGIIASVVVLLHRRGSGILAIRQSLRAGHMLGFLATLSFWFEIPLSQYYPTVAKWIEFSSNCFFMIGVFVLLFTPPQMLPRLLGFRRSSVIPLLRFLAVAVFVAMLCNVIELLVAAGHANSAFGSGNKNVGTCMSYCNDLVFNAMWPLAVYFCLRNDSNYWRGISNSAFLQRWIKRNADQADSTTAGGTSLQGSVNTILRVNEDGTDRQIGSLLADRIHQLPITLPHLDFAYLKMDVSTPLIGSGGSARVFNAKYKGQAVALKMVWCVELDETVITDFCRECALIASLPPHPNVLHSLGLCIFPPVLCLVTPLCISDLFHLVHPVDDGATNIRLTSTTADRESTSIRQSFGSTWRSMKSQLMPTNHSPRPVNQLELKKKQAESAWISACERNSFEGDSEFGSEFGDFEEEVSESGRRSLFVPMSKLKIIAQRPSYVAETPHNRRFSYSSNKGNASTDNNVAAFLADADVKDQERASKLRPSTADGTSRIGFGTWTSTAKQRPFEKQRSLDQHKDWSDTMQLCVDACAAVAFLHEGRVIHGDIKSGNFLVRGAVEHSLLVAKSLMGNSIQSKMAQITGFSAAATAKANEAVVIASSNISSIEVPNAKHRLVIADLGNSQRVDESEDDTRSTMRTMSMVALEGSEVMTPQWSPPEILLHHQSPSFSADIYSLAVVLVEILTNIIPFDGVVASEIIKQVGEGVRVPFPPNPPVVPEEVVDVIMFHKFWSLISQALDDIPHVRPKAAELLASAKAAVVLSQPAPTSLKHGEGTSLKPSQPETEVRSSPYIQRATSLNNEIDTTQEEDKNDEEEEEERLSACVNQTETYPSLTSSQGSIDNQLYANPLLHAPTTIPQK